MPANRMRTERWRDCLEQIHQRRGGLEIGLLPEGRESEGADLLWRVRILSIQEDRIVLECPKAAGERITLRPGQRAIAVMSIGQNRWMFHTTTMPGNDGLVIAAPERVERCQRRQFYRVSTASLRLPDVSCRPLLDPFSVVLAERANRVAIEHGEMRSNTEPGLMPDVGPEFPAKLVNLGGGGVGLLVESEYNASLDRSRMLWMQIDLRPEIPAPIALAAKLVHTHRDSEQRLHVGLAYEFSHNPSHRDFVVNQITRYLDRLQGGGRSSVAA